MMKLDTNQRKVLAANLIGFMEHEDLSLKSAQPVIKASDNSIWKWRNPTYYTGIQEVNAKRLAAALGHPFKTLTSEKIKWNGNGAAPARAARVAAPKATDEAPQPRQQQQRDLAMTRMFTVTLPDGIELSVAKGMKVSILSPDVIRIT